MFDKYKLMIEAGLSISILLLSCFMTWYATSDHYKKVIAEKQIQVDVVVQKQLQDNQALLADTLALRKSAGEERAKNQLDVNSLTHELAGMRSYLKACTSAVPKDGTTSQDTNTATGVLPDPQDSAFEELQRGDNEDFARCDQLNIDAIQANESLK